MRSTLATIVVLLATSPAAAQVPPQALPLCADRPGKATPACVVAPGVVQVETSVVDWARDDTGGVRTDVLLFADTLVKFGIGETATSPTDMSPWSWSWGSNVVPLFVVFHTPPWAVPT